MLNLVLYRKYRPLKFADVVSQDHVKTTLKNSITNGRIGHAYLFVGPRGVGKTTLARIYARGVNCLNGKDGEPCNECDLCREFLAGNALDIMEIDAASHTGVDNIRELIDHLQFAPTRAKYKVIIIDEVHMLSKGAFNALLKTLEEPPAHAIFILATTEIHKVPATIVSRSQRFDFKKAQIADLVKRLEYVCKDNNINAELAALAIIAAAAEGSFRDALSMLDQVFNFATDKVSASLVEDVLGLTSFATVMDFFRLIVEQKSSDAVKFVNRMIYDGKDLYQFQKDFLEFLRKVLILKVGANSDLGLTQDLQTQINSLSSKINLPDLIKIIEIFQKAGSDIKWTSVQSLPLELAAVESVTILNQNSQTIARSEGMSDEAISSKIATGRPQGDLNGADPRDGAEALAKILEAWSQILEKLKDYNHSLIPSLKLAKPVRVEGKELIITFPYKFHKDAVEQRKNKIVIDQVIEEVTGIRLMIKPVLEREEVSGEVPPAAGSNENGNNDLMESALKIMGGEIET